MIQTQQNTFVLFTLFKLTSDECKTLTKISTHKTSHNHSPKNTACSGCEATRKPVKRSLHNWWRIRSIRISSENTRQKKRPQRFERKQEDHNWFCIKILRYFFSAQEQQSRRGNKIKDSSVQISCIKYIVPFFVKI